MRIGFFGTPEIAAYCLGRLRENHEIAFVVTGEDKPAGRHQQVQISPVKKLALEGNITLYQPSALNDPLLPDMLRERGADIFVVVAYGKLIPAAVFTIPPLRTINLHPSLLPRYRGAAPIPWVLINGERMTGVSVQIINERLDAGDIVQQKVLEVPPDMTAGELYEIVLPLGASLVLESLELLSTGKALPAQQDESEATFCGKIDRTTATIDWSGSSRTIHNLVRGLNPRPVAWTLFRGKNIKIWKTAPVDESIGIQPAPGCLIAEKKRLFAGTGDGCIEILQLQPETKKIMDGLSFINGYRLTGDDHFEL